MMRNVTSSIAVLFLLSFSAGCGTDDGGGGATGGTGGLDGVGGNGSLGGSTGEPEVVPQCEARTTDEGGNQIILADPVNNYAFSSTLTFDTTLVKPTTELHFDWSALTTDFLGHAINPQTDVDQVTLVVWDLSIADLQQKLNDDALVQSDTVIFASFYPESGETSANLFQFTSFGAPIPEATFLAYLDPATYPPATTSYSLMVAEGELIGKGTRMLKAFTVDPTSTTTDVVVNSTSTTLTYNANLHDLQKIRIPVGLPQLTVDWTNLTVNAMGQTDIDVNNLTRVRVSKYTQTPVELETQFLDLELITTGSWWADVPTGTTMDLSTLTVDGTATGEAFPGIDATSTWIVALQCGSCSNPAPWYMAILAPCTP